ncbi:hypothetical protein A2U01_0110494, partial [Trifolium medium]|nr:hypothetical protein [Trifolium medium]
VARDSGDDTDADVG